MVRCEARKRFRKFAFNEFVRGDLKVYSGNVLKILTSVSSLEVENKMQGWDVMQKQSHQYIFWVLGDFSLFPSKELSKLGYSIFF